MLWQSRSRSSTRRCVPSSQWKQLDEWFLVCSLPIVRNIPLIQSDLLRSSCLSRMHSELTYECMPFSTTRRHLAKGRHQRGLHSCTRRIKQDGGTRRKPHRHRLRNSDTICAPAAAKAPRSNGRFDSTSERHSHCSESRVVCCAKGGHSPLVSSWPPTGLSAVVG